MTTETEMTADELTYRIGELSGRVGVHMEEILWARGCTAGMTLAWLGGQPLHDKHLAAKQTRGAAPYTLEQARTNLGVWGPNPGGMDRFEASGFLYGYREATKDRDDADVCTGCDQRILLNTQQNEVATCRTHGTFCDDDCADKVCDQGCWARNDRGAYAGLPSHVLVMLDDPPFDDETYHAERYGDEPGGGA